MNNFSNEPKNRKEIRNAIAKTVLKRYSFIVWLPILLYICNKVGSYVFIIASMITGSDFENVIITNIIIGLMIVMLIILLIILLIDIIKSLIKYLKENTIKTIWISIKEDLKEIIFFIGKGLVWIIKIPIRIFKRLISEPKKFRDSVQKEINKKDKEE